MTGRAASVPVVNAHAVSRHAVSAHARGGNLLQLRRWLLGVVAALWLATAAAPLAAQGALAPSAAGSEPLRASLNRNRVALDESTLLQIEIDWQKLRAYPDLTPLERDFDILSRNTDQRRGGLARDNRVVYTIELVPKRTGELEIPTLAVGSARTRPLRLLALPALNLPGPPPNTEAVLDASIDERQPYVQQSVAYVVRLYYVTDNILRSKYDQPQPQGAQLVAQGEPINYSRMLGDAAYKVHEQRYLLVPERPGRLVVPAATFEAVTVRMSFENTFGSGGAGPLRVRGPSFELDVCPLPANAPAQWLPMQQFSLRYLRTPRTLRSGETATVVVEAEAIGASAKQLPPLELGLEGGGQAAGQIFAGVPEVQEQIVDGRLRTRVVRRFDVLPAAPGALQLQGPAVTWWDARAGTTRRTALPPLRYQVGSAQPVQAAAAESAPQGAWAQRAAAFRDWWLDEWRWLLLVIGLAFAWVLALRLGLRLRQQALLRRARQRDASERMQLLLRMIDSADLGALSAELCALSEPPAADLDALAARLTDPAQRAALAQLQAARWGRGDVRAARTALRGAFANGPRWRGSAPPAPPPVLAPLYP